MGDGARESGAKGGRHKSVATLALPTYLPVLTQTTYLPTIADLQYLSN